MTFKFSSSFSLLFWKKLLEPVEPAKRPHFFSHNITPLNDLGSLTEGLDIDGIYRVSGNLSSINKLRGLIDNGESRRVNALNTLLFYNFIACHN